MSFLYKPKTKTDNVIKLPQVFDKVLIGNGAWPTEGDVNDFWFQLKSKLYNLYGWIALSNTAYITACEASHFISNITDVIKAVESFSPSMMALFVVLRSLHFRLVSNKLRDLLKIFSKEIWLDGERYHRKIKQCHRVMLPVFLYFILMFVVLILYGLIPIYVFFTTNQTMASTDKLIPYPMIFPYDVQKDIYYVATYISAVHAGYLIVSNFYAHDAVVLFFISYLCGQFEILHSDIVRLIPECYAEWQQYYCIKTGMNDVVGGVGYDIQPEAERIKVLQELYIRRLNELSARHNVLISFCVQLNDLISFPLLMNVVNSTFLICFCGFQFLLVGTTSLPTFMLFASFFLSVTLQLFVMSHCGTLLISCTTDTTLYLYMCNWEGGKLSKDSPLLVKPEDMEVAALNEKLPQWKYIKYYPGGKDFCNKLRFMIMRSQRPVALDAMKFTILSLEGFTKIIGSSMSYFALLNTFLEKQK